MTGRILLAAALFAMNCSLGCSSPQGRATADTVQESSQAEEPTFTSYDQATEYVRSTYDAERIDTSRSSWITGAEYYEAGGRGYLILGMRGRDYIFKGVPRDVWEGFRSAPSLGSYYNAAIRGRYYFHLDSPDVASEDDQTTQEEDRDPDEIYDTYRGR